MNALEDVGPVETPKKKQKYVSKRAKDRITTIEMPGRERSRFPGCALMRNVRLLACSTNSLWIAVEDVEWLVTWLEAEHRSGGVTLPEDAVASIEGNSSVPNVSIRWNFDGAWEATVIAGPKKGLLLKSYVAKLTEEKWLKVADLHKCAVAYENATAAEKKLACYHFLEERMKTSFS